ncbi:hypothetical protein GYA49_03295 [Candidatus Beckwithbacteria bacterium]|nr:hypothetical protein [Candidatus Beckwithbacteria bacterium]
MTKESDPPFTYINYEVCCYCQYLVRAEGQDAPLEGCGLRQNKQGQFTRVVFDDEIVASLAQDGKTAINRHKGCERFKASGLPAHPLVREKLVEANPKTVTIPEDPNALETSHEFSEKIDQYPHHEDVPSYLDRDGKLIPSIA